MRFREILLEYNRSKSMDGIVNVPKLKERLYSRLDQEHLPLTNLWDGLEQADPTPNKQYVNWMIKAFLNGSRFEDLQSRGADALDKLLKLRLRGFDISRMKTLSDLETVLEQYKLPAQPEKNVKRGKYKDIVNNSNVRIIQWFDQVAAKYYGQGTRWCTAANKGSMAGHYLESNNMFIIKPAKPKYSGEQYQLAVDYDTAQIELRNDRDDEVDIFAFRERFPELKQLPREARHIAFIENPTEEEQTQAVRRSPSNVKYIQNPVESVQLYAVTFNPWTISGIKNPSEAIQLAAVRNNGTVIRSLKNPSDRVKLAAVKNDGYALSWIDNPTEEMQLIAVKNFGSVINYISKPSEAVQLAAAKKNGEVIRSIMSKGIHPSEEVQLAAVQDAEPAFPMILKGIPNVSEKIIFAAIDKNPRYAAMELVLHKKYLTDRVMVRLLKASPKMIKYLLHSNVQPSKEVLAAAGIE